VETDTTRLIPGTSAERTLLVEEGHLASRWGSGGVDVFATPMMIGLMEQAAVAAVDHLLPPGSLTVGTLVNVRHVAATVPGQMVTAHATLESIDGRRLVFRVTAEDPAGTIGEGTHERAIVDLGRLLARSAARATGRSGQNRPAS
jgi:fluoroacetyl-CoA thioesterase